MSQGVGDHGPNPFKVNIEEATVGNDAFRDTLWTGENLQLTVMSIPAGGEIGAEIHDDHDQFLRIEAGKLRAMVGKSEDDLELDEEAADDDVVIVPAGKWHNFVNVGDEPAKLYSIYAAPEHEPGTYHATKADADADEGE